MTDGVTPCVVDLFRSLSWSSARSMPDFAVLGSHIHRHSPKSYAADGVVSGQNDVYASAPALRCGIFCDDWPSWYYALAHRMFVVVFIVVVNPVLFEDIKCTFSNIDVFLVTSCPSPLASVDVLCFNGRGSLSLSSPSPIGVLALFDWDFRHRGKWRNWRFWSDVVSHFQCGGTSSFSGRFTVGSHDSCGSWPFGSLGSLVGSFPGCNLSALVKCTIGGIDLVSDPLLASTVSPGTVLSLGKNLYHYKGLFPFGSWSAEFITPCVFTALKLVRRRLSSSELQEVLDVPLEGVRKRSFLRLLPSFKVPVKVLSAIVSKLFLNTMESGGGRKYIVLLR
jgi:hypothetical protein